MKVKFLGLLLLVFLQSCKTKKEMLYMQDINAYNNSEVKFTNPSLQPNDILKITVGALVPETAIPYNRISQTMVQTNSIEMMQLEGYLVSLEQTISFPILGEVSVANKTVVQLETDLINRLETGGHLVNPSVNVRLLNAKVTILGEVKIPGTYTFTENNINLLQAFGLAGDLTINGERNDVLLIREIDGGKETLKTSLPLVIGGQKGLVEESELRIPNMRGIMQARSKPLHVKEPADSASNITTLNFEKPEPKGAVKLVDTVDELVNLLHNEAKVI